jgi:hypothetical protein
MTDDARGPATEAELHGELEALLQRARDRGVDVRGGWECRSDADSSGWDVVVTELRADRS